MRRTTRYGALIVVLASSSLLLGTGRALAASPEEQCQRGRFDAAGRYFECENRVWGKWFAGGPTQDFELARKRCAARYVAAWPKLQARARGTGATCDAPRFVDLGDGTVKDNLTTLIWEKKTGPDGVPNLSDLHDVDNTYTWSAPTPVYAPDGTVFTGFLAQLDQPGACFAGACDWRLPTSLELQAILVDPYCAVSPACIDPTFGPTVPLSYWSGTPFALFADIALYVSFGSGDVERSDKHVALSVRAVRGGLL